MKNRGGQFEPELGGHFQPKSGGHFKSELGGQFDRNLQYADEDEIGNYVLQIDPIFCYPMLSDRLKALYKNQYEVNCKDKNDLDIINIKLKEEENDSDLPF